MDCVDVGTSAFEACDAVDAADLGESDLLLAAAREFCCCLCFALLPLPRLKAFWFDDDIFLLSVFDFALTELMPAFGC